MPTTHSKTFRYFTLLLCALFVLTGCGGDAPQTPEKPSEPEAAAAPARPRVPAQGVEVLIVRSHESLPSLHAPPPTPMTPDEAFAAVQPRLATDEALIDLNDVLRCEVIPDSGRVRFWIARDGAVEEDRAIALAAELAQRLLASAEARFQDRLEVSLLGLNKQLEAVSAQRGTAQQTLRDYLEVNRGAAETRETRREKAELERALSVVNERAREIQGLIATLESLREKGQPWYRREQR